MVIGQSLQDHDGERVDLCQAFLHGLDRDLRPLAKVLNRVFSLGRQDKDRAFLDGTARGVHRVFD